MMLTTGSTIVNFGGVLQNKQQDCQFNTSFKEEQQEALLCKGKEYVISKIASVSRRKEQLGQENLITEKIQ